MWNSYLDAKGDVLKESGEWNACKKCGDTYEGIECSFCFEYKPDSKKFDDVITKLKATMQNKGWRHQDVKF